MTDAPNLLSREAFDADAYLRCDCHERVNQTCDKCAIRTLRDAAYRRGLEDAAKVADELLSRANGAGSGRNWRDNPNYSGGEGISATAAAIAAAIRALKPGEAE